MCFVDSGEERPCADAEGMVVSSTAEPPSTIKGEKPLWNSEERDEEREPAENEREG